MFDCNRFKALLLLKGKTVKDVAKALEISESAVYRKMSGKSDFYRSEIQKCCELLGEENLTSIFFAS